MPRYRFDWSNHDLDLLRALAKHLRLKGDPPSALRDAYGARPKPEFIQDAWSALLENWLLHDERSCRNATKRLRVKGLGNVDLRTNAEYIRSIRNTSGARQIILEVFIQVGEEAAPNSPARKLAEASAPEEAMAMVREVEEEVLAPPIAVNPEADHVSEGDESSGNLRDFVEMCLAIMVNDDIFVDQDGDFVLVAGSAVVYVSILDDPESLRIFSIPLTAVPANPDLYRVLNDINMHLRFGRFVYVGDAILLEHYLLPTGLSVEEVVIVIRNIQVTADHFDDRLQSRFGGQTFFPQRADDEIDV